MLKKLTALILVCAALAALFGGCAKKNEEPTEYIGIISAMDNEIDFCSKRR